MNHDLIRNLEEKQSVISEMMTDKALHHSFTDMSIACLSSIMEGGKIIFCGNGGSAADSQHMAAELVGRFNKNRKAIPAISLTTDTSILTAIANDFGYENVFSRQLEALGHPGDTLICISTSGSSKNVLKAIEAAKQLKIKSILLTKQGSQSQSDITIRVPSDNTARIQEGHELILHTLCEMIEKSLPLA